MRKKYRSLLGLCLLVLASGCAPPVLMVPSSRETLAPAEIQVSVVVAEGVQVAQAMDQKYRGRLETLTHEGRTLLLNHVSLEEYVKGVLPAEVPAAWPREALKVQAVVARTYAWHKWQRREGEPYHLLADTRDQGYCGLECEDERSNRAVEETSGLVLIHGGKVMSAFSHSCCAGATEDIREVWGGKRLRPLGGVKCRWCARSEHYGPWILILDRLTLAKRLAKEIGGVNDVRWIRSHGETASGRVRIVEINAGGKVTRLPSPKFRELVGYNNLRSTRFEIREREESVEFRGTGWGHGVGLCQEGTGALASQGWKCKDILRHYFPGAKIGRLQR